MGFSKLVFTPLNYAGWGALEQLVPEVSRYSPRKIRVVTDPTLKKIGMTSQVTKPLEQEGYEITLYTEVVPEPPLETGEKLVSFTRAEEFDLVIGLGGGSALDLAKLAAVLSAHNGEVADYLNLSGSKQIENKGLPKILIPTTSGTGSEVTNISVLSMETTKDVVSHDYLIADIAIVDPALTLSLPPRVTAATGIDALTHAIEAYVSVNASPTTDGLALQAMRLISRSIRTAVQEGDNRQARIDMSEGSFLAGQAFFNAGVAGIHALAYPIGGMFHIPHGESNAVLLPYVMAYICPSCEGKLANILDTIGGNSSFLSEAEASYQCINELQRLVKDVRIPETLAEFDIPESALERLTMDAVKQNRLLARSPLTLEEGDIRKIYQAAFTGEIKEFKGD